MEKKYRYLFEKDGLWLKAGASRLHSELTNDPLQAEFFEEKPLAKMFKALFHYDEYTITEHEFVDPPKH